jgi:hypothetical protein
MESALYRGRRMIEGRMVDMCVVRRRTGQTTAPTGVITPTFSTVYTGKCRIQADSETGAERDVGQARIMITRLTLQIPIAAPALKDGDEVTISVSLYDDRLVGRKYTVRDVPAKTEATARRVGMIEVTS